MSTQTPPELDPRDEESHKAGWSDMSLVNSIEFRPRNSTLDLGHGTISSTSDLTSSDSVDASLLSQPLSEASPSAPLLPLYTLRVAFTASRTVNFAPGNLDQPIVFDQLHSNVGEMYNPRIGTFTCPVDGTYVFLFHILKLATYVPLYVNLMRNEEVMVSAYANDDAPDHETASNHAILPLFRGDQVWLRLHRGAIYGSTWKYSTFSGFLLYQD